jgi:glycosyltransferase involved in cell wall biosynthesis
MCRKFFMSEIPLVSVIIPVWNGAACLPETLRALQAQTYGCFEALIVDDGSTDETAARAQKFCETDARFSLIRQANSGVSAARNAAIARARGEWIAFLDADDVWLPRKLECQMELSRQDSRANFLFTNYYFWDGQRDLGVHYRPRRPLPDGDPLRALAASNVFGISTVMVRRELLTPDFLFDPRLPTGEDWDFYLHLAGRGLRARGTRTPLVRYRRWPGNISAQKLKMAEGDVPMLEKNLRSTQRPELRPILQRSLNFARAKLELAHARQMLDNAPEEIPAAIWRAWRLQPRRLKWLMWFSLAAWPKFLGGRATAGIVHLKLIQKF